jgi:Kdo2-lipid IVA lauroyltransferase/acyltransferase
MAVRSRFQLFLDSIVGGLVVGLLGAIKRMDRRRTANAAGAFMRRIGPFLPEHRTGRDNLRAAFPQKSDAEIEQILAKVWDNLGRACVEFAHLDDFSVQGFGAQTRDVVTYSAATATHIDRLLNDGRGRIIFAAHIANWELPAVCAKLIGTKSAVLFRPPGIPAVSDLVIKLRTPLMGEMVPSTMDAPVRLARLIQSGHNAGILADQHYTRGVPVTFFGRPCLANPLIAKLAQQTGAPIQGLRVIRGPDGNSFVADISDEVRLVHDASGQVDVAGTMQAVTTVIERWVREHPEQWLWLHRRWR